MTTQFSPGSLVRARGREWVVLPDSTPDLMLLQPLGGGDDVTGIYRPGVLEPVDPATFALPDPSRSGDARSSRLLREAVRLGFRSGAGPFRSFGRIAVEPRPYQLVPLLLALQLDPVRLLIADDVGVGKTVEAGLIARELLDRGEVSRLTILCPPHLAQQWVDELREKFHIEAVPVLPSTARRLEASCGPGESLFDYHPFTVVSLDYIKTDNHRADFIAHCPPLVIVDEAHTCAQTTGARQLRHKLLKQLTGDATRHMVLVSATPHSGNTEAFRSLLSLLRPEFIHLPDDLSGTANAERRRELARHLVQRRRADIEHYLASDTPFPKREPDDDSAYISYNLSPEYKKFFDRVLAYARESVQDETGGHFRQRVRWWAALGLLRALASSPDAASATLRARARNAGAANVEEADQIGRRGVLDLVEDEAAEAADLAPGAQVDEEGQAIEENVRRLLDMAREAEKLAGSDDRKLQVAHKQVSELLNGGFHPIVFCRFINTAHYVANHLRTKLKGVEVVAVTGLMNPDDRKAAVEELAAATQEGKRRVLVATDCLSEGINLQAYFDAVFHYDLPWNPTRLEQREGRVDRFGQPSKVVRALTLYGKDNQIDGIVLDVLLRKHRQIRKALGVSVPVPADSDAVVEAIFEGLLLRGRAQLTLFEPEEKKELDRQWDAAVDRERRSRTVFSHEGIKAEEVAKEVDQMRHALGGALEVEAFTRDALATLGQPLSQSVPAKLELTNLPLGVQEPLRTALPARDWKAKALRVRFDTANASGETLLGRTHPLVATLASHFLDTSLDSASENPLAARCGAMRTGAVTKRTTLLLVRMRFHIHQRVRGGVERALLAEDCALLAFRGATDAAEWLDEAEAEALLNAPVAGNLSPDQVQNFVTGIVDGFNALRPSLEAAAQKRAQVLLESHRRVRDAARSGGSVRVEAQPEPDVLGIWVYLPVVA
jgi:superfamily II DNA or RNA helicase